MSRELIRQLKSQGVALWVSDGRLHYSAPPGIVTDATKTRIRANKAELVQLLSASQSASRSSAKRLPLSREQQRIWFLVEHAGAGAAFNTPLAVELRGVLNTQQLARALQAMVARHASLRTCMAEVDGKVHQVIRDEVSAPLSIVDLSSTSGDRQRKTLHERLSADLAAQLPLEQAPLFRATLYLLTPERQLLHCVFHHLVFDADSAAVFLRDLARQYSGDTSVAANTASYSDYLDWQKATLASDAGTELLKYWQERLNGIAALNSLPSDKPRAVTFSYAGRTLREAIDPPVAARLRQLAPRLRLTMFTLLHTAFVSLIHKLSGTRDVVIGTPASSRFAAGFADVIGLFSNMLVLRTGIDPAQQFAELAKLVQLNTLDALDHQALPFDSLVEHLKPSRDLSHAPLFQIVFAYHRMEPMQFGNERLQALPYYYNGPFAKYDLQLSLVDDGQSMSAHWEFSTGVFHEATVQMMMRQFHQLLAVVSAQPELSIAEVGERVAVCPRPSLRPPRRPASAPQAQNIVEAFATSVALHGDKAAVKCGAQQLNYSELDTASSTMAARLCDHGVKNGAMVSIMAQDAPQTVVAILAVLKAGGAYLPLGLDWPAARIRSAMQQANSTLLMTGAERSPVLADVLSQPGVSSFALDGTAEHDRSEAAVQLPLSADSPAYVIFTSGSTGVPKGVLASHRNVIDLFRNTRALLRFGANDVWLLKHALTFDYSVWEMWGALLHGGTLVIPDHSSSTSLTKLARLIADEEVTMLSVTPSFFSAFEHRLQDTVADSRLRCILFSGEELPVAPVASWLAHNAGTTPELWNLYGITENTVFSTAARIDNLKRTDNLVHIGRPLPNHSAYVLDDALNPAAKNAVGEMYLCGQGLTMGYIGAAAQTAERFLPNAFAADGSRMYRTGDRVRTTDEGCLTTCGRNDSQVKLRGYRIDCADVEFNLEQCELVRQAKLVLVSSPAPELVAFVTLTDELPAPADTPTRLQTEGRIGAQLAARLPAFMLPGRIFALRELPLTGNGKVDTDLLRRQFCTPPEPVTQDTPADAITSTLLDVFSRHLETAALRPDDDYFAAGANSLMLLQIKDDLEGSLGVEIPLLKLFRYHTVALLADWLRGALPAGDSGEADGRAGRRRAALARYSAQFSERPESG